MLLEQIKARMFKAMKEGRVVEKEILRVAVGEITTQAARPGSTGSDEEAQAIIRKLIKSNQESMALSPDVEQKKTLELETAILSEMLPQSLTVPEIITALAEVREPLCAAANEGQATGVAMKHLKGQGAVVNGKDVSLAVKQLRAAT